MNTTKKTKIVAILKKHGREKLADDFKGRKFFENADATKFINVRANPKLKTDEWDKILRIISE